jgi:hypothetical protein
VIQKRLVDPLALAILEGRFAAGDTVEVFQAGDTVGRSGEVDGEKSPVVPCRPTSC